MLRCALLLVALLPSVSQAQWFPNAPWNQKRQVSESEACPGGVCPTGDWVNNDGLSARQHIEQVHGTNTAGMSRADVLASRNAYHNAHGAGHPVSESQSNFVSHYASVSTATQSQSGYGSSGARVSGYGSTGGFGVGSLDRDGAVVTSVGVTVSQVQPRGVCDCCCPDCKCNATVSVSASADAQAISALRIGDRARMMKVMLAAAREARGTGPMDADTVTRMRAAMVDAALEELAASSQAIDIDKWIEIIERLIPIIMKLIELFGMSDYPDLFPYV